MFFNFEFVLNSFRKFFAYSIFILFFGSFPVQATPEQAQDVLKKAIEAYGGLEVLNALERVQFGLDGIRVEIDQSYSVTGPFDIGHDIRIFGFDFSNQTGFTDIYLSLSGGLDVHFRTVVNENEKFSLNLKNKTFRPNLGRVSALAVELRIPPLFMKSLAAAPAETLEYQGTADIEGKLNHHLVSRRIETLPMNLYFDAETYLLTRLDFGFFNAIRGDTDLVRYFDFYHQQDGIQIPGRFRLLYDGEELLHQSYNNVRFNQAFDAALVAFPDRFVEISGEIPPDPVLTQLAEGVYLIDSEATGFNVFHGYNALVVEMDTYVIVIDTPISSANSMKNIILIKEKFPEKPIKFAIPTHHHADHAGGLRQFVFEEATIVTTSRNRSYYERMFSHPRERAPDDLSENPKEASFEIVDDRIVFSDGPTRLEIINIGPTPHAEDLYVAFFPSEKLIFAGDSYFSPRAAGSNFADNQGLYFARKIAELGLEVETIVQVHGLVVSMDDLLEAVRARYGETD